MDGQWHDRGQQTVWQALTDLKSEAVAKSSGKASGEGKERAGEKPQHSPRKAELSFGLCSLRWDSKETRVGAWPERRQGRVP